MKKRTRMNTWVLFAFAFLGWGAANNAVFIRDASREPIWRSALRRNALFYLVVLLIGLLFLVMGVFFVHKILFLFVFPLIMFALALALALGPVVVEERLNLSWAPLLAVPYDMKEIMLGKISGALWHIRPLTYAIVILMMCISGAIGMGSLTLIQEDTTAFSGWYQVVLVAALFVLPVLSSLLFVWDRVQHYALLGMAALALGSAAPSIRSALSNALLVVLLIWLIETAVTEAFLTLDRGEAWQLNYARILSAATLGPVASAISQMDFGHAVFFIGGTLLLREALFNSLWRWTLNQARR
jgi:hypothetical protein